MNPTVKVPLPQRGPQSHERREQIIETARSHFSHYGYSKTSMGDIAKLIGVSNAYLYKFFSSKQDIAEAVCAQAFDQIDSHLIEASKQNTSAITRLRLTFKTLLEQSLALFFEDRKLHEIAALGSANNWCANTNHQVTLYSLIEQLVLDGREEGVFDRKAPLDEVCRGIVDALIPISNPLLLEQKSPEMLEESLVALTNMVLRSLSV